jgi:hypothetical protein
MAAANGAPARNPYENLRLFLRRRTHIALPAADSGEDERFSEGKPNSLPG